MPGKRAARLLGTECMLGLPRCSGGAGYDGEAFMSLEGR